MGQLPTLQYGTLPRRRRFLKLVVLFILAIVGFCGWHYHGSVRAFVAERYAAYQFAREFDRVSRQLVGNGDTWVAVSSEAEFDRYSLQLLSQSAAVANVKWITTGKPDLFVRASETGGRHWLSFAKVSETDVETITFDREDRTCVGWDRSAEYGDFWGYNRYNPGPSKIDLLSATAQGDAIEAVISVNGGRNIIDWSVTPQSKPAGSSVLTKGRRTGTAIPFWPRTLYQNLMTVSAQRRTGWVSGNNWFPNTRNLQLIEGPSAIREVRSISGAMAISFLPDNRIAVASRYRVALLNTNTAIDMPPKETAFLDPDDFDHAYFSQDGLYYLFYGRNGSTLITTATGDVQPNPEVPAYTHRFDHFVKAGNLHAMTTDGGFVTVFSSDHFIKYHLKSGEYVRELSFSPYARWLAIQGGGEFRLFDMRTGEEIWEHSDDSDFTTTDARIKWSQNGMRGAVAGGSFVYVWSLELPRWVARFPNRSGEFTGDVAISADGKRIAASAAGSTSVALWPDIDAVIRPQP